MASKIKYSMCWEDPELVTKGLNISTKDSVLTIASGGENVFALLLENPKRLVAIDGNPYQIYLVKLKATAIQKLSYEEFYDFLGFKPNKKRWSTYLKLEKELSLDERKFWRQHKDYIQKGIISCGKFESYLKIFRHFMHSLVLNKKQIHHYLSLSTTKEQEKFFANKWDGFIWRSLFYLFFSKAFMQLIGRDKSYFRYNKVENVANHYYMRSKYGITQIPVSNNYFMHIILTGTIPKYFKKHPYLDKSNFLKLKKLINKIEFVHTTIQEHLRDKEPKYTKFDLSDIFEKMSQSEYGTILSKIVSNSPNGTRICYWNNMVQRKNHKIPHLRSSSKSVKNLFKKDRVFFYSKFLLENVKK